MSAFSINKKRKPYVLIILGDKNILHFLSAHLLFTLAKYVNKMERRAEMKNLLLLSFSVVLIKCQHTQCGQVTFIKIGIHLFS